LPRRARRAAGAFGFSWETNVSEAPQGYRDIPEADQKKAKAFLDKGRTVAETGQYDYAIEMYLNGLKLDPDSVEAHEALREISLKRKASRGKPLGMFGRMRMRPTKDDKQNMLNAEKMLAHDPGNTDHMVSVLQNAHRAGFYDTVLWMGPILLRANADSKSPDVSKFVVLKDIYRDLRLYQMAVEACYAALQLNPLDMDLQTELKNLGAQETIYGSGYAAGGDFRTTMRNKQAQDDNIQSQKDVVSSDVLAKAIADAETEFKVDPSDPAKLNKLVEALERTDNFEHENRAIELLDEAYQRTQLFSFRLRLGQIKMNQLRRVERSMRAEVEAHPNDARLRQDYEHFRADQIEFELKEYTLFAEKYPTELKHRYEAARRLFLLRRYDEAIPLLQQSRQDPKLKIDGSVWLGCAFLEAGYADEAVETLQGVIDEYQIKGDDRAKWMYYSQGRAFEAKGNMEMAIKRYSQVTQWEFTYRDVQLRIKRLRSGGAAGAPAP
jgi:tetratricopeptide (TPR) repeat protein